jgi:hemerythrin-like domain-containing protein
MSVTGELVREHQIIERVLQALQRCVRQAEAGGEVPVARLRAIVTFSRSFIDRCHHGKEEQCLFPCLERLGVPREGGPIGVMLQEHEMGRRLVAQIATALDGYEAGAAGAEAVLEPCRRYGELLGQHIFKENNILFPMGESLMTEEDQDENRRCFHAREEALGPGEHQRLTALGEELAGDP